MPSDTRRQKSKLRKSGKSTANMILKVSVCFDLKKELKFKL